MLGNVPLDLLSVGTPQQVKEYVKKLVQTAGKGGGFILGNGAFFDNIKAENLKAMMEAGREHGLYR
jgi:uroporphyrinogen-III decarboxylase